MLVLLRKLFNKLVTYRQLPPDLSWGLLLFLLASVLLYVPQVLTIVWNSAWFIERVEGFPWWPPLSPSLSARVPVGPIR